MSYDPIGTSLIPEFPRTFSKYSITGQSVSAKDISAWKEFQFGMDTIEIIFFHYVSFFINFVIKLI